MSKIDRIIPINGYEIIRDRLGEILADELANQFVLNPDPDIQATVYVERSTPFDKTETSAIVVSLSTGTFTDKSQVGVAGRYTYNIDGYTNSKSIDDRKGDKLAALKLHRILGICRVILEDPQYKTLGYTPGFITRVFFNDINIAQAKPDTDALDTSMGRMTLTVVCNENNVLITPNLIEGYETKVKLSDTEKGYAYVGENYYN